MKYVCYSKLLKLIKLCLEKIRLFKVLTELDLDLFLKMWNTPK